MTTDPIREALEMLVQEARQQHPDLENRLHQIVEQSRPEAAEKLVPPPETGARPDPHRRWLFLALAASLAAVVLGASLWQSRTAHAAARRFISQLESQLASAQALLARLRIEQAIDDAGPHLIVAGRDRLGVRCRIDARYIKEVRWQIGDGGEWTTVYQPETRRPDSDHVVPVFVSVTSEPLKLDGRVMDVALEFVPYGDISETQLAGLIREERRIQRRQFLLLPTGITPDPRPIDQLHDIAIHSVLADADEDNPNRYFVAGKVKGMRQGMQAFLAVDAVTGDEIWITAPLQVDPAGDFGARAFLGPGALDGHLYGIFVVVCDGEPPFALGDSLTKPVQWEQLGCLRGAAVYKRNDGSDGWIAGPREP